MGDFENIKSVQVCSQLQLYWRPLAQSYVGDGEDLFKKCVSIFGTFHFSGAIQCVLSVFKLAPTVYATNAFHSK